MGHVGEAEAALAIGLDHRRIRQMRPLVSGHFDRVTDLDHVEPIGFERIRGELCEAGWRRGLANPSSLVINQASRVETHVG